MGTYLGPNIVNNGLVLALDSYSNIRGFTKYGTSGTNNNHRAIRNLVDNASTYSMVNTSHLVGGINYYTIYGLTYPESSQTPSSRQGITPGFENISSSKLYDMSRDLGYFVFDEITNTWISDSYFNGERINGHCYDTYDGAPAQHATFQADYDNIKNTFPNATHIIIGSHASENIDNNADTVTRLKEIGLPDDAVGLGRVEFVLAGKVNKPWTHHYVRENVSSAVANMVIGLPLEGIGGGLAFDGTNDGIQLPGTDFSLNTMTISAWNYSSNYNHNGFIFEKTTNGAVNTQYSFFFNGANNMYFRTYGLSTRDLILSNTTSYVINNQWNNVVATFDGTYKKIYINGVLRATSGALTGTVTQNTTGAAYIGVYGNFGGYFFNGNIANTLIYNKALTAQEIQSNYNSYKKRFNL